MIQNIVGQKESPSGHSAIVVFHRRVRTDEAGSAGALINRPVLSQPRAYK